MGTYVLVHGGFHGGWCWERVAERLRAVGHRVYTPTLTGLGERSHLLSPDVSLYTHIDDVLGVIRWERLENVILCGHSYGGMVVTGVADAEPERIGKLVYADAFVPTSGQCLFDLLNPERSAAMRESAVGQGRGWLMTPPSASSYDIVDPSDCKWVDSLLTPHPLLTCTQKLVLAREPLAERVFIYALGYRHEYFRRSAGEFQNKSGWSVYAAASGHDMMIDAPAQVAAALIASGT